MRRKRVFLAGISVALLAVLLLVVLLRPEPEVLYEVTFLPALGGSVSVSPHAINDRGQVVGVAEVAQNRWHMFLWDEKGGMRDLGPYADPRRFEYVRINNASQIAATAVDPNGDWDAFLQDPNGVRHILPAPSGEQVHILGLNNRGQVVGYCHPERGPRRAFVWDKTTGMRSLAPPNTIESLARSINDAGQVVGFLSVDRTNQWYAFLWDPNADMQSLGLAQFGPTHTCHINNQGLVVGQFGSADDKTCVSIWTRGTGAQRVPSVTGASMQTAGLNDANRFVACTDRKKFEIWRLATLPHIDSYLWDPNEGFTEIAGRLGRKDVVEFFATDINNKGRITGLLRLEKQPNVFGVILEPIR